MHKSKHDLFMCKTNNDYTRQIHSTLQSRFGGAQHWTFWACSLRIKKGYALGISPFNGPFLPKITTGAIREAVP